MLLMLLNVGWALPSVAGGTLLQALLAQQRGDAKADWLAVITTVGAVVAVVSSVLAGAWSDRTRSRIGRRHPWILGGALTSAAGLALTGVVSSLPAQIATFALFQGGLNAMQAATAALVPDRVANSALGRVSAYSGVGYLIGSAIGGVAVARLIVNPGRGLLIIPWTMLIAAILLAVLVRGYSNLDLPRLSKSARPFLRSLLPPRDRDFLLVFAGRFSVVLGLMVMVFYQLYVLTDFLHLDIAEAGQRIALGTAIFGAAALVTAVCGGLVSDRWGRRKPLVQIAALLIAASVVPMVIAPSLNSQLVYYVIAGAGSGLHLSVDQALMVQVLPTAGAEAKELGMLSVANSAPSVIAPVIATAVVSGFGFRALFLFTIVVSVLGALCVGAVRRVR